MCESWQYQISISFSKIEMASFLGVIFLCLRVIQQHLADKAVSNCDLKGLKSTDVYITVTYI